MRHILLELLLHGLAFSMVAGCVCVCVCLFPSRAQGAQITCRVPLQHSSAETFAAYTPRTLPPPTKCYGTYTVCTALLFLLFLLFIFFSPFSIPTQKDESRPCFFHLLLLPSCMRTPRRRPAPWRTSTKTVGWVYTLSLSELEIKATCARAKHLSIPRGGGGQCAHLTSADSTRSTR